ncbi:MAG: response regulator [Roseburia sp.]|nr:response regulator [Roseburia sp.]
MQLLKLIIVDDERIILQGMTTTFDWNSIGFQVVGTAMNGEDALKLIEEELPDVVLTDIRMKKMDGITLMERAKAISLNTQFVVLSAYKDFEYAKRACALGALEYIVKPVNDEMMETMKRVYDHCIAEKQKQAVFDRWKELLVDNKEGFGAYMIEHYLTDELTLDEIKANYALFTKDEVEKHNYTVLCMDVDIVYKVKEYSEFSAKRFALFSYVEKKIKENYHMWAYKSPDGAGIFIVDLEDHDKLYKLKMLVDNVRNELGFDVISSVSKAFTGFEGMRKAYNQCLQLYSLACELETDLEYNVVEEREEENRYPYERARRIISAMRKNDEGLLKEAFIDFLSALGKSESTDKFFLHQLAVHAEQMLQETYGLNDEVRTRLQEFYGSLFKYSSSRLFHMCYEIFLYAVKARKDSIPYGDEQYYNEYVSKACAFIEEHLDEEGLSIGRVADEVHLNPIYFGRVFKSVKNMSYKQYLLKQKVERAKELLLTTDASIMEISCAVGISNASYFTKLFKQIEGILPSGYKEKNA